MVMSIQTVNAHVVILIKVGDLVGGDRGDDGGYIFA